MPTSIHGCTCVQPNTYVHAFMRTCIHVPLCSGCLWHGSYTCLHAPACLQLPLLKITTQGREAATTPIIHCASQPQGSNVPCKFSCSRHGMSLSHACQPTPPLNVPRAPSWIPNAEDSTSASVSTAMASQHNAPSMSLPASLLPPTHAMPGYTTTVPAPDAFRMQHSLASGIPHVHESWLAPSTSSPWGPIAQGLPFGGQPHQHDGPWPAYVPLPTTVRCFLDEPDRAPDIKALWLLVRMGPCGLLLCADQRGHCALSLHWRPLARVQGLFY